MFTDQDTMYHYCSLNSFFNILETRTMWLSHIQTTNDKLDDRMFTLALRQVLNKYRQNNHPATSMLERIERSYSNKVDFPYISCFTHSKDLLSQWRAYGDDGRGVCIGFDLSKFSFIDLLNNYHGPCKPLVLVDEISYHNNDEELIEKFLLVSELLRKNQGIEDEDQRINII